MDAANSKLWLSYLIIIAFMLLTTLSYAFWLDNVASRPDVLLEADSVTYFTTFLLSDNEQDLLFPPIAEKHSLANNDIIIETPASVVERTISMSLISTVICDIKINANFEYKDNEGNFVSLQNGILDAEIWFQHSTSDPSSYQIYYNQTEEGYIVENFENDQTSNLIVKIYFTQIDELIDPYYKQRDYKLIVSFEAIERGE